MMDHGRYPFSAIVQRRPLRWPQNARVALWVIPNIEHFVFDWTLAGPLPDVRNYARRDYGNRVGIWRMMEVLARHGVRGTVALNAMVCEQEPEVVAEAQRLGWEFMGHGLTNSRRLDGLSEAEERVVIQQTLEIITRATGQKPQGWLGPGLIETENTPDLLAEAGLRYVCDWVNDDQPYVMQTRAGRLIAIPYSIEINDMVFFSGPAFLPQDFRQAITDQFDVLYREGAQSGRVMAICLHPFLTGAPFRIKYLDEALNYILSHEGVWCATGAEIVDWYVREYLDKG